MFKNLFDIEADENVVDVQFAFGNDYWWFALVVLVGLAAYSVYLYRSESWLSKNRRLVSTKTPFAPARTPANASVHLSPTTKH